MKKPSFTIKVNNPCTESWDDMTPAGKGRHCAACRKTVIDFSVFTDREIIRFFKENKSQNTCGHFLTTQLDHELIETRLTPSFSSILLKRIAASLLFFQTIANTAWAQTAKAKTAQHTKTPARPAKNRIIKGRVMDYVTKGPLQGMKVRIDGTPLITTTDKYGRFHLALPDSLPLKTGKLKVFYPENKLEPAGTMILDMDIYPDSFSLAKEVIIYRYPQETLKETTVAQYKKPLMTTTITGAEIAIMPTTEVTDMVTINQPKKKTFWQKIFPFHKKKKTDE